MDWRSLPPLSALRAFAAFAETGNVVEAGAALGVSHAAVSQQLKALEQHLDAALLDRSGRGLRLTATGEQLAAALRLGFEAMGAAVAEITGAQADRPLHISTTPTFASVPAPVRVTSANEKRTSVSCRTAACASSEESATCS